MICEKSLFHEKADNLPLNSIYGKGHDHEKFANLRDWFSYFRICELFVGAIRITLNLNAIF